MVFSNEIVVLAILTKLGIFPIYYWFPAVCEGLSWNNIFLLITLQKIIPIYICLNTNRKMIIFRVIFRGSIRVFLLLNSTCLRKILAFSSMHNLSWIIIRRIINNNYWVLFIIIYSIIIFEIRQRFYKKNYSSIRQIIFINNKIMAFFIFINFLSLRGIPPFLGFFLKWIILLSANNLILILLMVLLSTIIIYIYISYLWNVLFFKFIKHKKYRYQYKNSILNFNFI